jgi:hypothetical protein
MDERLLKIFEKFKEDPNSTSRLLGGVDNMLTFLIKKGFAEYLDPEEDFWYQNELQDALIWQQYQNAENKMEYLKKFVKTFFSSDIAVEGDKIFLILSGKDGLEFMFDDRGRNTTARDIAKSIFADDTPHFFDDVVGDFYDDCIMTLNKANQKKISEKIVSELQPLSPDEFEGIDFLEELWEVQGQPEKLKITSENIDDLLFDDDAITHIITKFFPALHSDMENAYWNAYNSAYESELYNKVYGGVKDLLGDSGEFVKLGQYPTGKDRWVFQIDITKEFPYLFEKYFSDWKNHYNQIEYYGSFTQMLNELMEESVIDRIDFRIPDYPDSREIEDNYNEYLEV